MIKRSTLALAAMLGALPVPAWAQAGLPVRADSGDTAALLAAAALVLLAGLSGIALQHCGRLRPGNRMSVLLQSLSITAVVTLVWTVAGYTIAFGDVSGGWIGAGNAWMLIHLSDLRPGTAVPESAFVLFQLAVATIAPVLMTGAWAERARFGWVMLFSALWTAMVAAPLAHWIWGGGWLARSLGALDWAGGLGLFLPAGISALVVALMMGRRLDPSPASLADPALQANALSLTGSGLVWIGGIALCAGWAFSAGDAAAAAAINGHIAMASSVVSWIGLARLSASKDGKAGLAEPGPAVLAGLAAVATGAGFVSPGGAMLTGVVGALAAWYGKRLLARLAVDDANAVFATAGLAAIAGSLLCALFQSVDFGGTGYASRQTMIGQIAAQAIAIGVITIWSAVVSAIAALMASILFPMRVSEPAERAGLDASSHGIARSV